MDQKSRAIDVSSGNKTVKICKYLSLQSTYIGSPWHHEKRYLGPSELFQAARSRYRWERRESLAIDYRYAKGLQAMGRCHSSSKLWRARYVPVWKLAYRSWNYDHSLPLWEMQQSHLRRGSLAILNFSFDHWMGPLSLLGTSCRREILRSALSRKSAFKSKQP